MRKGMYVWISRDTYLPFMGTIHTSDICCHRFISTTSLHLKEFTFSLFASATLKHVCFCCSVFCSSCSRQIFLLYGSISLFSFIRGHLFSGHLNKLFWQY